MDRASIINISFCVYFDVQTDSGAYCCHAYRLTADDKETLGSTIPTQITIKIKYSKGKGEWI